MTPFYQLSRFFRQAPSLPQAAVSSSFPILNSVMKIEEEQMPAFKRGLFYPVKLGDVFCFRYQVLSKLGFGANLTV